MVGHCDTGGAVEEVREGTCGTGDSLIQLEPRVEPVEGVGLFPGGLGIESETVACVVERRPRFGGAVA
jgi:hypothetical protein